MSYLDNMIRFNNDVSYQSFNTLEMRSQEEREKDYADASVTDKPKFIQLAESTIPKLEQLRDMVGKEIFKTAKRSNIKAIKKRISDQINYQKTFIGEHTAKKTESIGQTTFQVGQKATSTATNKSFELMRSSYPTPKERFHNALQDGEAVTQLDLSDFAELDNEKLKELQQKCPNLRSLNLSNTPIAELNLSILADFSKLEQLDVSNTDIAIIDKLPQKLKQLNVSWCGYREPQDFEKFKESFSKLEQLEQLDISGNMIETLDMLLPKNLKQLNIGWCQNLGPEEFEKLNESFSKLEKLDIARSTIEILDNLPKGLKELNLHDCANLNPEAFAKLKSFLELEKLDVSNTWIETLDNLPKSLKELNLRSCRNLKEQELQKLASFDKLQVIYLPSRFKESEVVSTLRNLNKQVRFK